MESIPHASGIYQILCVPTGKIYIGSAVDFLDRWRVHRNALTRRYNKQHHSPRLQHAWDKYGEGAFVFTILEYVPRERLIEVEQQYLDRYRPFDRDIGFNISPTAQSIRGMKFSDETRRKMSLAKKGKKKPPMSLEQRQSISERNKGKTPWLGRKHTPEAIANQRAAKAGTKWSEAATAAHIAATSKTYVVTNPDGNEMVITNLSAFCREHGLIATSMTRVAYGRHGAKQHRGWKCRLA